MKNASHISGLWRFSRVLALACSPILLAGCQHHEVASSSSFGQRSFAQGGTPTFINTSLRVSDSRDRVQLAAFKPADRVQSKDQLWIANDQKKQECLTVELGDALLDAFKVFTNRP
jgi:hypothetical protein